MKSGAFGYFSSGKGREKGEGRRVKFDERKTVSPLGSTLPASPFSLPPKAPHA
jgi:hypothetical protein